MNSITKFEKEVFEYLNILRNSGVTNMFGAAPYLMEEFTIDKYKAKELLTKWMHNFNEDGYDNIPVMEVTVEAAYLAGFVPSEEYDVTDERLFKEAREFLTSQALRD